MEQNVASPKGIQSVEHAIFILDQVKKAKKPLTLTELSTMTGMSKSRLQKYLVSFVKLALLTLNEKEKTYNLGPKLIELGLSAQRQFDIISVIAPFLLEIKEELNQSSLIAFWTEQGPTIVNYQGSGRIINVGIEVGSYTPLLKSSVGKCFAAFLPEHLTKELFDYELVRYELDRDEVVKELNEIRALGFSYRDRNFGDLPGNVSAAAPVFDHSDQVAAVVCIIGFEGDLNVDRNSKAVNKLKEVVENVSRLLGQPI